MRARFVEPMLLLKTERLPEGASWQYELKLDGYRALAFKAGGAVHLRSRNDHDFTVKYPAIPPGLAALPDDTLVDGELVALDADGRPSFNALQHATRAVVHYFVFDVLIFNGKDLTTTPLKTRRRLLEERVAPLLQEPVQYAAPLEAPLADLIHSVKALNLEGLIAKRLDSRYEPGQRSGAWLKMRVNRGQEFVIGGYTVGTTTFDALIFGVYENGALRYAARTRSGFTPAVRATLFKRLRALAIPECPFSNLPEEKSGRWSEGLTSAKMASCRWVQPVLVAHFEFLEWTEDNHLRHSRFVGLREDKKATDVRRE